MGPDPFASGGYGDVYQGTLDGSRVCIKRIREYIMDGPEKAAKVRYQQHHLARWPRLTKPADLLQRGCDVETLDTPEHCAPTWCYYRSLPACFNLDV